MTDLIIIGIILMECFSVNRANFLEITVVLCLVLVYSKQLYMECTTLTPIKI